MAVPGKDFKIQVNGTSGSWNEVGASDAPPEITRELLDVTEFGDEFMRRIFGLGDVTLDVEATVDATSDTAFSDLDDGILSGTEIDVEWSPDGNASGGPTTVYAATFLVSSKSKSNAVDSEQTATFSLEYSAGGTGPTTSGTFSS